MGFGSTATPGEFETNQEIGLQTDHSYVMAYHDILSAASQLPTHSHNFMEIFCYTSDHQVEYLIGSHRYILRKGDIICIPPGTLHQVLRYEPFDTPCTRELIGIMPFVLEYFGWSSSAEQYYLLRGTDELQKSLGKLCTMCVQEYQNQNFRWRDMLISYIQILLIQILRHPDQTIRAEPDGLFEKVLSYINSNLAQKITLTDTARYFYTSERTITREFQKNLGISFYRYVTQRRLLLAQNLIFNGIPMKEICLQTGFTDYPTFFRAFKNEFGISPRQMKKVGALPDLNPDLK